ncbi:MAG: MBL fold metallo-hydrolase [Deltaproteobacteria bacterium]|nr:MBL fold metallo-hydrolase [Deltaproteobacteria bacterium]
MKVTILGCGTATGVPMIGCHCQVCSSTNPRNRRTRSSILVQRQGRNILIDTSPDLWAQAIKVGLDRLDAVIFTHSHADHLHGIDELRSFNFIQHLETIPCYANDETLKRIREGFSYLFSSNQASPYARPRIELRRIDDKPFGLFGGKVTPLPVRHGPYTVFGYRFGNMAYVTDASSIPVDTMERMAGLDLLIIGALRQEPHPKHFSIDQAAGIIDRLKPRNALLTHMSHKIDYDNTHLPRGVDLAYDGLVVEFGEEQE